ncbi:hypothetical protein [Wolbachia endosymbiont (group A) of Agelastica alni]|uniref:hypothetical protein n=1 Tax=Wolbachia endosymbiont (group A) of Agelastica alni TaxID=3066130 RepID=UPI003132AFAB
MPSFSFGKFLNVYSNMNWAGRCHSSAPFFVIRVAPMMSFQCLTLESSFPYNLIENVVTTFYVSLLAYKQTFLDPSIGYLDDS